MAAITIQDGGAGWGGNLAAFAAATGGGDTITTSRATTCGGWQLPVVLLVRNADATPTDVTVAGTPLLSVPATTGFAAIPVLVGQGCVAAVTYSKVTSLTVAAVRLTSSLA
jgi:hypothetical protein